MAYWVRKISRGKWPEKIIPVDDMPADIISKDLRTEKNTLSFWRIENLDDLERAALALAASSKSTSIETIEVVYIPEEDIYSASFEVDDNSPGDTIVPDLAKMHRDLCALNFRKLGMISSLINNNIHQDHCQRFTKSCVKKLLKQAYIDQRICKDKCADDLYIEISKP